MLPIGQDLKRERELRGISLKEIAESTKINIRFLRALEEEQFDVLPGKFFTRGIIRGYAKYLGLEEESVLNKYHDALQFLDQGEKEEEKTFSSSLPMNIQNVIRIAAFGAAVIAVLVALFFIFQGKEAPPPIQLPTTESTTQRDAVLPLPDTEPAEEIEEEIEEEDKPSISEGELKKWSKKKYPDFSDNLDLMRKCWEKEQGIADKIVREYSREYVEKEVKEVKKY